MKNNFRELREQKGYSQDEIAKKLQITRQAYGRYESGERECSFSTLRKLGDFQCDD